MILHYEYWISSAMKSIQHFKCYQLIFILIWVWILYILNKDFYHINYICFFNKQTYTEYPPRVSCFQIHLPYFPCLGDIPANKTFNSSNDDSCQAKSAPHHSHFQCQTSLTQQPASPTVTVLYSSTQNSLGIFIAKS